MREESLRQTSADPPGVALPFEGRKTRNRVSASAPDAGPNRAGHRSVSRCVYLLDAECRRPRGRVVAFEPIPQLAEYLRQLQVACRFERLTVVQTALSNTSGERSLFVPTGGHLGTATLLARSQGYRAVGVTTHTSRPTRWTSSVTTMPSARCTSSSVMWKGTSWKCSRELRNAYADAPHGRAACRRNLLREDRPVLLVECVDSRPEVGQTDRVFPYLEALGYRGYFFPHGRTESLISRSLRSYSSRPLYLSFRS